jgi:hypothetical protein
MTVIMMYGYDDLQILRKGVTLLCLGFLLMLSAHVASMNERRG